MLTFCFLKEYSRGLPDTLREVLRCYHEDFVLKNVASSTAQILHKESAITKQFLPQNENICSLIRIAWIMATGDQRINIDQQKNLDELHEYFIKNNLNENHCDYESDEMYDVCQHALETITLMLLLAPQYSNFLSKSAGLQKFFIDLILITPKRAIRMTMAYQFSFVTLINLYTNSNVAPIILELVFNYLQTYLLKFHQTSGQLFQFCCRLLEICISVPCDIQSTIIDRFIEYEYNLLSCPKVSVFFICFIFKMIKFFLKIIYRKIFISMVIIRKHCWKEIYASQKYWFLNIFHLNPNVKLD